MQAPSYLIKVGDTFYAQVRVPSDICGTYGRKQQRKSLRTKDYDTAVDRLHAAVVEIKAGFAKHRADRRQEDEPHQAPPAPTLQSFADLGRQHGRIISQRQMTIRADLYEAAVADPKEFWRHAREHHSVPEEFTYFDKLAADGDLDRAVGYVVRKSTQDRIADLKRMIDTGDLRELLDLAEERQPQLDRQSKVALALTLARAEIAALHDETSDDLGHRGIAPVNRWSSGSTSVPAARTLPPVSLDLLFEKWKAETKPSASTLSTWRGIFKSLKRKFPDKADDVQWITAEDFVRWKDDLVASGKSAKTINDSYFACVRTVLTYGVNNKLLGTNPAIGVKMSGGKSGTKGGRTRFGYTNAGVARLLELARRQNNPDRRWLPWLAAQTGSRISEVAQLQGNYVKEEGGIHYLDIKRAPDGGSIKETFSERTVPIHPQLIEDGFLDFVASKGEGPLFYGRSSGDPNKKHASKGVANRLAAWIRANGFTDKRIDPNHGLRHWFKTYADEVGISDRMADRLQGHATKTDAGGYYNPELSTMLAALKKVRLPPVGQDGET